MSDVVLAVDGGNSKTDVALVDASGALLAAVHGPTVSHQAVAPAEAGRRLAALVREAERTTGVGEGAAAVAVLCLAGVDTPHDVRVLRALHGGSRLAARVDLHNDTWAALRAGAPGGWGVAVVVGEGINAVGITRTGREIRFAGLGPISGDRGGGHWLGMEALGAAVRAQDRRGPATVLSVLVPRAFGVRRPLDVTAALYHERVDIGSVSSLAPLVVAAAREGDAVANAILDVLADDVAAFALAAIRRGGMLRAEVPVVLSGGVARGAGPDLAGRVERRVRAFATRAHVTVLRDPPVLGAVLLALDARGTIHWPDAATVTRLREAIAAAFGA